ncbi:hypothetical protein OPV22_004614 [Ensete ventricosum]|uniref:Uncharacterized protein n=1 Tax=Ensete ventricosum TaxID=4639 RepID=A0AAV8RPA7_ENSVE|nr:hypothetical protein OPV22_004614 [Ensete ventricosum]
MFLPQFLVPPTTTLPPSPLSEPPSLPRPRGWRRAVAERGFKIEIAFEWRLANIVRCRLLRGALHRSTAHQGFSRRCQSTPKVQE